MTSSPTPPNPEPTPAMDSQQQTYENVQLAGKRLAMEVWSLARSEEPHGYETAKSLIRKELHAQRAAAVAEATPWRPIETAPKCKIIDLFCEFGAQGYEPEHESRWTDCEYDDDGVLWQWIDGEKRRLPQAVIRPKFWMFPINPPNVQETPR